jgi:hypothetical protein
VTSNGVPLAVARNDLGRPEGLHRRWANLPYNARKAAVIRMTKSLALAHVADGVRVNCVCPGFVETDMWASLVQELSPLFKRSPEEFAGRSLRQIPLGRMELPEDVAGVIGFLVSPRSAYMTGHALSVDGGLVRHGRSMGRFCLSVLLTPALALACVEPKPTATMKVMAVTELRAVLSRVSGRYSGFERAG